MPVLTTEEITRLTPPERLALIGALCDSLDDRQPAISLAQQAELDRRLASFDADRAEAVSWDKIKTELASRRA
jgi:putative addiction module component (TIGR02574 family)